MIDLHTHSTASDGSLPPAELVARAHECGIHKLALTDHDTVAGLADARAAGNRHNVDVINGVEISAAWAARTIHVLGLGINPDDASLLTALESAAAARMRRARRIGEKLEAAGITNAWTLTCQLANGGLIGRAHFARMLVDQKHAKDNNQVFRRFMVRGKPGYVAPNWMSMERAVGLIMQSGGIAVLAHPAAYALTTRKLHALIGDFAEADGAGIEVISGRIERTDVNKLAKLADEFDLLASAGSDFHGPDKPWIKLGQVPALPAGCRPVWEHSALSQQRQSTGSQPRPLQPPPPR